MTIADNEYQIETLPHHLHRRDTEGRSSHNILVSRRNIIQDKAEIGM